MILKNIEIINEQFFDQKFANRLLSNQRTLRIGNIISFISPVDILIDKRYKSDNSINFCVEIPEISNYAGACFAELFTMQVASILGSRYIKDPIEIINSDIIIKKEHNNAGITQLDGVVSLKYIKNINGAMLIYLGLYNNAGDEAIPKAYSLKLEDDVINKFMDDVNGGFYNLANGIFLQTSKM